MIKNGVPNGVGISKKIGNSLDTYEGEFVNGHADGFGVHKWPEIGAIDMFEGYFTKGKKGGFGRYIYYDG